MPKAKIYHVNPACNKWEEDNHMKHMQRRINAAKSTVPTAKKGSASHPSTTATAGGGSKQAGAVSSQATCDKPTRPVKAHAQQQIPAGAEQCSNSNLQLPEGIDMKQLDAIIIQRLQQVLAGVPLGHLYQQATPLQAGVPVAATSKTPSKQASAPVCAAKRPPMPKPCKQGTHGRKNKAKQQQADKTKKERPPWQEDWALPGPPAPLCAGAFPAPKKDGISKQRPSASGTHASSPQAVQKRATTSSAGMNALKVQLLPCSPGPSRPVSCSRYTSPTAEKPVCTHQAVHQTTSNMYADQAGVGHRDTMPDTHKHIYNDNMHGNNPEPVCLPRMSDAVEQNVMLARKAAPQYNKPYVSQLNTASFASSATIVPQHDTYVQAQHGPIIHEDEYGSDEFEVYEYDNDEELVVDGGAVHLTTDEQNISHIGTDQNGYNSQLEVLHTSQLRQSMAELIALVQHKIHAVRQSQAYESARTLVPGRTGELGNGAENGSNDLIGTLGLLGLDSWTGGSTGQLWGQQCLLGTSELQYIEQQSHKSRTSSEPEFHTGDLPAWMNDQGEYKEGEEGQAGVSHDSWHNNTVIEAGPPAGTNCDMHGPDASHADDASHFLPPCNPYHHPDVQLQHPEMIKSRGLTSDAHNKGAGKLTCMPGDDDVELADGDDAVLLGTCPDTSPGAMGGMQADIVASATAAAQALGLTVGRPPLPKPPPITTLFPPPSLQVVHTQLSNQHGHESNVYKHGVVDCPGLPSQSQLDGQDGHTYLSHTRRPPIAQANNDQLGLGKLRSHGSADAQQEDVSDAKDGLTQQATALWDSLRQLHQLMTGPKAHEFSPMGKAQRAASAGSARSGFNSVSSAASPLCTTPTPALATGPCTAVEINGSSNTTLPIVCL